MKRSFGTILVLKVDAPQAHEPRRVISLFIILVPSLANLCAYDRPIPLDAPV